MSACEFSWQKSELHKFGVAQRSNGLKQKVCAYSSSERTWSCSHCTEWPKNEHFHQAFEKGKLSESLNRTKPGWSTEMFCVNCFHQNFLSGFSIHDQLFIIRFPFLRVNLIRLPLRDEAWVMGTYSMFNTIITGLSLIKSQPSQTINLELVIRHGWTCLCAL